jgi:hypothetical protein
MNIPAMRGTIPPAFTRKQIAAMTLNQLRSHHPGSKCMAESLRKLADAYSKEAKWMEREIAKRSSS